MNDTTGKAGVDGATISGLRERVRSGLPPKENPIYEEYRITLG